MSVWCLDVHAGWTCRHTGACCSAGWAIPVERSVLEALTVHFGPQRDARPLFLTGGALPDGAAAMLARKADGSCVFFEADPGRLCEVHRTLGVRSLPVACWQFPRMALHDPRGTLITLSHFCPSVAELLLESVSFSVVQAPSRLGLDGEVEGLDATTVLPPLLRPGLLTDIDGYAAWEGAALNVLARGDLTADAAVAAIGAATDRVERWRPGGDPLFDAVRRAFDGARDCAPPVVQPEEDLARRALAIASIPPGLAPPPPTNDATGWSGAARWWPDFDHAVRAWLAARLFGNWIAYTGHGLRAIVEYLRVSLSVLRVEVARQEHEGAHRSDRRRFIEAVRQADRLLVHLSDAGTLGRLIHMTSTSHAHIRPRTVSPLRHD